MKQALMSTNGGRCVAALGALVLALAPGEALAHDNVGGDEFAVANWMLVAAMVTIVLGIWWGIWAIKTGQFNNVESSKYTMLENAEDYDALMAEYDAQQAARRSAESGVAKAQTPTDGETRPKATSSTVRA